MAYKPNRPPRVKQAEGLKRIRGKKVYALRMAMRTGKTGVIINDWGRMVYEGKMDDLFVMAPAGAYLTWAGELPKDLPPEVYKEIKVYIWDSKKERTKIAEARREAFLAYKGPRVLLMNTEAISAVETARQFVLAFLSQRPHRNTAAIDESVSIKNPEAKCALFAVNHIAPLAGFRRIMTGLITPRSPLDIYPQFAFLDRKILGFEDFVTFKARHAIERRICTLPNAQIKDRFLACAGFKRGEWRVSDDVLRQKIRIIYDRDPTGEPVDEMRDDIMIAAEGLKRDVMVDKIFEMGGYIQTIPVIDGYMNVEEIYDKIAPHSFRVRLEDCYDMPASDYSFRDIEMTDEQERIYNDMKKYATAQISEHGFMTASQVIVQMLRMHQVLCGHSKDDDTGEIVPVPEKRTAGLLDLLEDYDGKAIIWCSYDADVTKLTQRLQKVYGPNSVSRFWGGNRKTREQEEKWFKEEDERRWMLATPDAGKYSRTWDMADLVVYFSQKNNLDHRLQSEERAKNVGKTRPVAYVDMRVPNTVEDKIIHALRNKLDLSSIINGDNWREWVV